MRTRVALVLAVLALPTPLLGAGFLPGALLQLIAGALAVRTLTQRPAEPPREERLALLTFALLALPWAVLALAMTVRSFSGAAVGG